jgi:hypothetical protein
MTLLSEKELGDSLIGEFAGLVNKEKFVDIGHQLALIDSFDALMSPATLGSRLAGLLVRTAAYRQHEKGG